MSVFYSLVADIEDNLTKLGCIDIEVEEDMSPEEEDEPGNWELQALASHPAYGDVSISVAYDSDGENYSLIGVTLPDCTFYTTWQEFGKSLTE